MCVCVCGVCGQGQRGEEEDEGGVSLLFRGGAKKKTRAIAVCCYETYRDSRREETDGTKKIDKKTHKMLRSFFSFFFLLKALHHDKNMHYVR